MDLYAESEASGQTGFLASFLGSRRRIHSTTCVYQVDCHMFGVHRVSHLITTSRAHQVIFLRLAVKSLAFIEGPIEQRHIS